MNACNGITRKKGSLFFCSTKARNDVTQFLAGQSRVAFTFTKHDLVLRVSPTRSPGEEGEPWERFKTPV